MRKPDLALAAHFGRPGALGGVSSRPDFVGLMWPGPTPFETKQSQLAIGASRLHGTPQLATAANGVTLTLTSRLPPLSPLPRPAPTRPWLCWNRY